MELRQKLAILADAAKYDASCASSGSRRRNDGTQLGDTTKIGICHSYTPDGRCVSLLKILLTNYCIYDCQFCVNRVTSDTPRARFTPAEVAHLTIEFYKRNYIEGLFLSSGIIRSVDYTMEQLIEVARLLRYQENFNGYIHLKTVPGASPELIERAGLVADRLSANVELPTQEDLDRLAPEKSRQQIEKTMQEMAGQILASGEEVRKHKSAPKFAPAGQSTQMIVGATASTDGQILQTADALYRRHRLRRVYYSAYSPIPHGDDRLPPEPPPLIREHRLYQSDWLIRFYGFGVNELTTAAEPNLSLEMDPKLSWALRNRDRFPVDLNKAPRELLLRIPGLGVRNVDRIIQIRRHQSIRLDDLAKLRAPMRRIRAFVITADHNPEALRIDRDDLAHRVVTPHVQLELFAAAGSARTGEV
ncbi:putative DNA modification/repair radical SAM protein [Humisphaera borealis]|uniref:Putative DNA modification/repair radical SAM protein n=1 Tax=Humisphaera borealis TaxID=2807512 RepID=A0A7M2WYB6_9BACT|nr:putative DNA modification/repair radical SAM protein [Humisphaera borealis]QOV90466.1 putative DNA modification/repair radical SAM protein [Humisphaera borealis]